MVRKFLVGVVVLIVGIIFAYFVAGERPLAGYEGNASGVVWTFSFSFMADASSSVDNDDDDQNDDDDDDDDGPDPCDGDDYLV